MLALPNYAPCLFSTTSGTGWSFEGTSSSIHDFPVAGTDRDSPRTPKMDKTLHHNASERDRRKKMNHLYSNIRSMLPPKYHTKKMSIPCTISHVLKYIPELKEEVNKLKRKKEELLSRICKQEDDEMPQEKPGTTGTSHSTVSASRLRNGEVAIQISMDRSSAEVGLSEMLLCLEEEELLLLNASCFETSGGKILCNLHLKAQEGRCRVDCKVLSEKLLSLHDS